MKYLHLRKDEGLPLKPGLTVYPLSCTHSFGFMLELDTRSIWFRYSKRTKKFYWDNWRREPLVWRILKERNAEF